MKFFIRHNLTILAAIIIALFTPLLSSCSDNDEPSRKADDIYGAWQQDGTEIYTFFRHPNTCYRLNATDPDNPKLDYDAYYYEPGYNFLLYVDIETQPDIYQVGLNNEDMQWIWADNLRDDKYDDLSKSEILGMLIKQAQEGFSLDYSRTLKYHRIERKDFEELLTRYGFSYVIDDL